MSPLTPTSHPSATHLSESGADRPALDIQLRHREMHRVPSREPCPHTNGRGRNQAVGLTESDSPPRMVSAPAPRQLTLRTPDRRQAQALQEAQDDCLLLTEHPPHDLLNVDRTDPRGSRGVTQGSHSISGGTAAQHVDQNGRVEQQTQAFSRRG